MFKNSTVNYSKNNHWIYIPLLYYTVFNKFTIRKMKYNNKSNIFSDDTDKHQNKLFPYLVSIISYPLFIGIGNDRQNRHFNSQYINNSFFFQ